MNTVLDPPQTHAPTHAPELPTSAIAPWARGSVATLIGAVLIGLGALLLAGQALSLSVARLGWPMLVILPGLAFFLGMVRGGAAWAPLAIPGSITTATGLLLLYQNISGHWASWAYAWALIFPTALGLGAWIQGWWAGQTRRRAVGGLLVLIGGTLFLALAAFFELGLNGGGRGRGDLMGYGLPAALIAAGAALLARQRLR